jgi:UPF0271 protein
MPRSRPGSVLHDPNAVVARAVRLVRDGRVTCSDGTEIAMRVDTLCTHGDTPGAAELTRRLREGLQQAGIAVSAAAVRAANT